MRIHLNTEVQGIVCNAENDAGSAARGHALALDISPRTIPAVHLQRMHADEDGWEALLRWRGPQTRQISVISAPMCSIDDLPSRSSTQIQLAITQGGR